VLYCETGGLAFNTSLQSFKKPSSPVLVIGERDRWAEAVRAASKTFGDDHDLTRCAKALSADAKAEYGSIVDVLIPLDRTRQTQATG